MKPPPPLHDETHEDLLHAHLAGDLEAEDERLTGILRACSTCRARLTELRALTGLLEEVGHAQRRTFSELPDPATAPGADRVATTLRALAAGRAPARFTPRSATLWRISLAAASVLAAGWVVKTLLPTGEPPRKDVLLGERKSRGLTPQGTVVAFDRFTWEGLSPIAVSYELRIWRDGTSTTEAPLIKLRLVSNHWQPNTDQQRELPDAIDWGVTAFDELGEPCDVREADALRVP